MVTFEVALLSPNRERLLIRILLVDDFEDWRKFASSELRQQSEFQVVAEASDGFEAVKKAEELQPDLIILDVGLPGLNGIKVAYLVRSCSPQSKILVASAEHNSETAEEALRVGAHGYVVKSEAKRELLTAVKTVLKGKRFVTASLREKLRSALPHLRLVDTTE